jgi:uncharacterized protein YjbJ (UPF0337 family)
MHSNVSTSSGKWHQDALGVHVRQQWGKFMDAGRDMIAGRKDRSVGVIHATYGVTKIEAEFQVREFERIRRGYQPSLVD